MAGITRTSRAVGIAVSAVLLGSVAACGDDDNKGLGDAPVGYVDDRPGVVVNMPNGYPNWRIQCRHGDALISFRDEAGGQRAILDEDSNQCDGNKVKRLPTDKRVSGTDTDEIVENTGNTPTTDRQFETTSTTLDR